MANVNKETVDFLFGKGQTPNYIKDVVGGVKPQSSFNLGNIGRNIKTSLNPINIAKDPKGGSKLATAYIVPQLAKWAGQQMFGRAGALDYLIGGKNYYRHENIVTGKQIGRAHV